MTFGTVRTSPVGELLLLRSLLEPHQAKFRVVWAHAATHPRGDIFMLQMECRKTGEGALGGERSKDRSLRTST